MSSAVTRLRRDRARDADLVFDAKIIAYKDRAYMSEQYRNQYRPSQLDPREMEFLAKSARVTAPETVLFDAHPRWKEHGAASRRKSLAGSVESEHLKAWLQSSRGQEWAKTRKLLFQNPDAQECKEDGD